MHAARTADLTIWVKPLSEANLALPLGVLPDNPGATCSAVKENGGTASQRYYLRAGEETFLGFCDQTASGGGWLKILHGSGVNYHQ